MKKTLTVLAAGAALAVATVAAPQQADAAHWGHGGWGHRGWGGGAVLGGLAAGAIIGGALASPYYGYGYYDGGPYYAGYGGPYYGYGGCWTRRVWTPYGWHWRRVCR